MAQPEQPRGILQITGSDRVSFLQNLVTNEIDALGLHYAALLSPQGKYIADFFVLVRQNDILIDVSGEVKIAENTIKTVNDSINRLEDMETKYEGYEYYLQCVKRDGIPYELISDVLPKLEVEINNILQPLVDFQILLNTDGKNINSYIAYGEDEYWPLELTSGMEKFISSIAIRTALTNVSNLPRPNFIAIDEGFGSLDSDNFNSLYLLFDYLKTQFDFLVTISEGLISFSMSNFIAAPI